MQSEIKIRSVRYEDESGDAGHLSDEQKSALGVNEEIVKIPIGSGWWRKILNNCFTFLTILAEIIIDGE